MWSKTLQSTFPTLPISFFFNSEAHVTRTRVDCLVVFPISLDRKRWKKIFCRLSNTSNLMKAWILSLSWATQLLQTSKCKPVVFQNLVSYFLIFLMIYAMINKRKDSVWERHCNPFCVSSHLVVIRSRMDKHYFSDLQMDAYRMWRSKISFSETRHRIKIPKQAWL